MERFISWFDFLKCWCAVSSLYIYTYKYVFFFKVNLEVKDCSPQKDTTDLKYHQPKPTKTTSFVLNKTKHAQKSTDHGHKTTAHAQKSCSRNAAIGYFVIDWIVFIGIIMQFTFVFIRDRCKNCIKTQQWISVYKGFIFFGKYAMYIHNYIFNSSKNCFRIKFDIR